MSQRLPIHANLDHLRRHAKTVLRAARYDGRPWCLADAQRALARGFGFESWTDLKRHVTAVPATSRGRRTLPPHPTPDRNRAGDCGAGFEGIWISEAEPRILLAIDKTHGAVVLTQVATDERGRSIANTLVLNDDGEEHPLPFGEDLTVKARWRGVRSLETIVRRGTNTVGESVYTLADDGRTLNTASGARQFVFARLVAIVAAVLLASGCAASSLAHERAIDALNQHDIKAALGSDVDAVVSQWSEGFVLIPATGPAVRGKAANVAMVMGARKQLEEFEPVAYAVDFEEITVTGEYAFAWGTFRTSARRRSNGAEISSSGKLLRIYQRQPDGRWLMHRTMSTIDSKPQ